MPSRQRGQRPQPAWISTATRSPTANSSTVGPSLTTVPMYSWPGVKPLLNGSAPSIISGTPCFKTSMSVAQTAIASIRTSTSAGPGSGTFFSTSDSSSGPPSTQAFIVSGIGYSLLPGDCRVVTLPPVILDAPRYVLMSILLLVEPDTAQVLPDKMARSDVPTLYFGRGYDDPIPPQ